MKTVALSRLNALGITPRAFAARVARMAEEIQVWREHEALVRAGQAMPYPAPTDIVDVMEVIDIAPDGSMSTDYTVEDDTPQPTDLVPAKKVALVNSILALESLINQQIESPLKARKNARLVRIAEMTRSPEDQATADMITAKGEAASPEELTLLAAIDSRPAREPQDAAVLAERDRRATMREALDEWIADKLAEIDDLTVDDIDSWAPGSPPVQVE